MKNTLGIAFVFLVIVFINAKAFAHSGSTAYIELIEEDGAVQGAWSVSLHDLQVAIGLDLNFDDNITYAEYSTMASEIIDYASNNISFTGEKKQCVQRWQPSELRNVDSIIYAQIPFTLNCSETLFPNSINYSALVFEDNSHRVIIKIVSDTGENIFILSPSQSSGSLIFENYSLLDILVSYLSQGVIHILEGYDHLLFLIALLIPLIFSRPFAHSSNARNIKLHTFDKSLFMAILMVVSSFTLGHSITLVLATVFSISPPIAWVESFIALSVVIAGINIVLPLFKESSWKVAGLFGLIHGFGFASVLSELELTESTLAISLFSFNVGVELGQLLVVVILVPVFLLLTKISNYTRVFSRYSAASISVVIGSWWLFDRLPLL